MYKEKYIKYKKKYFNLKKQNGGLSIKERKEIYHQLNTKLSYLSDNELTDILSTHQQIKRWGINTVFELDGIKIFCKQIKMTEVENNNKYDTSNLFNLPTYYNYGIGSSGINCFRELLMHIKTTNWVLDEQIENFPLMYHYRLMKIPTEEPLYSEKTIKKLSNKWNNQQVEEYLRAKNNSEHYITIFLEYVPIEMEDWLNDDYQRNKLYFEQMMNVIRFLSKHNIIHFDAHLGNILTNGQIIYLTDFGLVYDAQFKISEKEREFYSRNSYYDYGMIISNLFYPLEKKFSENAKEFEYLFNPGEKMIPLSVNKFFDNFDAITQKLNINESYLEMLKKCKKIILLHENFFIDLIKNPNKDTIYPNDEIKEEIKKLSQ